MAGIYIHIPFCKKACHYCNFHFSTSLNLKNDFSDALLREIALRASYISQPVSSIYLGGGTPSLLSAAELNGLFEQLHRFFTVLPGAEITLEANPDDITLEKTLEWKKVGINRLSIGIQSFFEEDLAWMNRAHTAAQSVTALQLAREQFEHLTIDLIYGVPTLSDLKWKENVDRALAMNIPHLSCYALTVEPKTALQKLIEKHKVEDVNPGDQARQFLLLMEWLGNAGYEHYEISNFALPAQRSRHNSSYWQGLPYIGLGPSAHSYNGISRQWNIANNAVYIQSLREGHLPFESENLTSIQRMNEYVMTSLRTMEGLDLARIESEYSTAHRTRIESAAHIFIRQELLTKNADRLILTRQGKLFADGIAADLFADE